MATDTLAADAELAEPGSELGRLTLAAGLRSGAISLNNLDAILLKASVLDPAARSAWLAARSGAEKLVRREATAAREKAAAEHDAEVEARQEQLDKAREDLAAASAEAAQLEGSVAAASARGDSFLDGRLRLDEQNRKAAALRTFIGEAEGRLAEARSARDRAGLAAERASLVAAAARLNADLVSAEHDLLEAVATPWSRGYAAAHALFAAQELLREVRS